MGGPVRWSRDVILALPFLMFLKAFFVFSEEVQPCVPVKEEHRPQADYTFISGSQASPTEGLHVENIHYKDLASPAFTKIIDAYARRRLQEIAETYAESSHDDKIYLDLKNLRQSKQLEDHLIKILESNDLSEMQHMLSMHSTLPSDPYFAQILFRYCQTENMASLLLEYGLSLDSITLDTYLNTLCRLHKDHKKLIDWYISKGLAVFLEFDSFDGFTTLEFAGCGKEHAKYSLRGYPHYPHLKAACHRFVLQELNWHDPAILEAILKHFPEHQDYEGLDLFLQDIANKIKANPCFTALDFESICFKAALYCIEYNQFSCFKVVDKAFPWKALSPERQQYLLSKARHVGSIEIEELIHTLHLPEPISTSSYRMPKTWTKAEAELHYPALKGYTRFSRALSQSHQDLYGREQAQEAFRQFQQTSLLFTLSTLNLWKPMLAQEEQQRSVSAISAKKLNDPQNGSHEGCPEKGRSEGATCSWIKDDVAGSAGSLSTVPYFRELLISLGLRRRLTAIECQSPASYNFGVPRDDSILTSFETTYQAYASKAKDMETYLGVNGQLFILSSVQTAPPKDDRLGPHVRFVKNEYTEFWNDDDPVFIFVAHVFDRVVSQSFSSEVDLKNEIAKFHWLMAHVSPFKRGSASITEILTDALWIYHGYVPQRIEKGQSLDLEALIRQDLESYQQLYPQGKKCL